MGKMALVFCLFIVMLALWTATASAHCSGTLKEYVKKRNARLDAEGVPVAQGKCEATIRAFIEHPEAASEVVKTPMGQHLCSHFREDSRLGYWPHTKPLTLTPQQIHLSITEKPGNVSVIWLTNTSASSARACWTRGPSYNASSAHCVSGATWTYNPITLIPWTGNVHGAFMINLVPGHQYCYVVGDSEANLFSSPVCFMAPDLRKQSIQVAFGGDMGSYQLVGYLVAAQMRADELAHNIQYDAFWLLGDIAYSTLDPPKDNLEFVWDTFLQQEEPFINHVPMTTTYGNHDFSGGDSAAYLNRFFNPGTGRSGSKFYWSYRHGPVYVVNMCTEVGLVPIECNYAPGSRQYQWIESEFANVNRSETPWLILTGHRPMYSSDLSTDSGQLQQFIEPLLIKYKVDVELSGHMHETELISPVNNNVADLASVTQTSTNSWLVRNASAPAHITIGSMGALIDEKWQDPSPSWSLFHAGTLWDPWYGYGTFTGDHRTLHFKFHAQKNNATLWEMVMKK